MTNDKTVLVTGACGEIGQALVQELSRRGGCRGVTAAIAPPADALDGLVSVHGAGGSVVQSQNSFNPSAHHFVL